MGPDGKTREAGTPQRLGLGPAKLVAKHPAPGAVDKSISTAPF